MKNLSAKASKIYNLLEVRHCEQDNKGVYCIYSRKEIAKDSGTNEKTVQRALNELEEQMYISRSKQGKMQAQRIYLLKMSPHSLKMSTQILNRLFITTIIKEISCIPYLMNRS